MYTWSQTYEIAGVGALAVEQHRGRVRVTGSDRTSISVTATCASEQELQERLSVRQEGNTVRVAIEPRSFFSFFAPESPIDLEIEVPVGTVCHLEAGSGNVEVSGTMADLEAETGSGGADVRRAAGNVRVETGSGHVRIEEIRGTVEVEVGSGHVAASGIEGEFRAETGSGDLTVADVTGSLELETGSGSVKVGRVRGTRVSVETGGGSVMLGGLDVADLEVETGSGTVTVELVNVPAGGEYHLETGSGSVSVAVPVTAGVQFDVETGSGRVRYDELPLQVLTYEKGEFSGRLNGGGARVEIEANSGNVNLRACQGQGQVQVAAGPAPAPAEQARAEQPVMRVIKGDAALSNSEHIRRVLDMVKDGKLSVEQAEELLKALDEEEAKA